MSQAIGQKAKKRKHASADAPVGEPSTKRSKTAKVKDESPRKLKKPVPVAHSTVKDARKKEKGKVLADGQFRVVDSTLALSIPPVFAGNLGGGAEEMLDSMVMRYVPALQGVLLAHDSLQFLSTKATLKGDCPFSNCTISFRSTVWSPRVGMKLIGKVNLCSPDHISLLVHRTFNVSIPRHHIPTDNWEFEYGPAENDPEFGVDAPAGAEELAAAPETVEDSGRWVHKTTGDRLGGSNGELTFTVIGLTIANDMLSLLGSIQHDPFSSEHMPENSVTVTTSGRRKTTTAPLELADAEMPDEEIGTDEEDDPFAALGRITDADAAARRKREEEEAEAKEKEEAKEKKRKRKEEKAAQRAESGVGEPDKKKKKKTKGTV